MTHTMVLGLKYYTSISFPSTNRVNFGGMSNQPEGKSCEHFHSAFELLFSITPYPPRRRQRPQPAPLTQITSISPEGVLARGSSS